MKSNQEKFHVINTLDLSGCPEAVAALLEVASIETLPADRSTVLNAICRADAYLASLSLRVDEEFIRRAKKLKVIGSPATGTDHLDLNAIAKAKITCFDISKERKLLDGFTATSELAFGLVLALSRRLIEATNSARNADWARERFSGFQLYGKTLGVLGMGRLGEISTKIGVGFGMRVIAYDPVRRDIDNVEWTDFDSLFRESDVVTVHVHLTEQTQKLVNERVLRLMKPTALLINTSRGGVIDEVALLKALRAGWIKGAGLDVINGEWSSAIVDHPLIRYANEANNLLITPHIGGATRESIVGARIFMALKVANYLRASY